MFVSLGVGDEPVDFDLARAGFETGGTDQGLSWERIPPLPPGKSGIGFIRIRLCVSGVRMFSAHLQASVAYIPSLCKSPQTLGGSYSKI